MTELLITPAKGALKTKTVLLFALLLSCTVTSYLAKGLNALTLALLMLTVLLSAYGSWRMYIASKTKILINKTSRQIEVTRYTFFGSRQQQHYPVMYFGAIRSYISLDHGARNVVELITNDGHGSLHLSSFMPRGGKKFWSVEVETEHPDARQLVSRVANFIPVQNLGFVGHHFAKLPLEKDRTHFIKHILNDDEAKK
ncbi:hypothetical protein [Methylophilus sp.]|uniref:hypothetical protein n=1 Tax=Methylophilus sp. TaxID=29541 RepID=UPI004035BF0E